MWDMNELLYDVRRDALRKFYEAKEEDCKPLLEAIQRIIEMSNIAWKERVMAPEDIILEGEMECMENFLFLLSYFKNGLDYINEIASNEYWTRNLQGIQAMIFYIYYRGVVCIFKNIYPGTVADINISLLPKEYPRDKELLFDNKKSLLRYTAQKQEKIKEQQEKELLEKKKEEEEKQLLQKFRSTSHNFQNTKLLEKLRELEQEILENLSDQSVKTILRFVEDGRRNIISRCLYGLGYEARMKIIKQWYTGWWEFWWDDDKEILVQRMKFVVELEEQEEEEILGAALMMLGTIKRLRRTGKIQE